MTYMKASMSSPNIVFGDLQKNWNWFLVLGVLLIMLGTIGLSMTFFLTMASVLYFGVLLLIGGGAQIVHAFNTKGWKGMALSVITAILYLVAGIAVIRDPVAASAFLTLIIAAVILAVGIIRIVMAFQLRGSRNWVWLLMGGIVAVLLGMTMAAKWPVSGLWVIGLFVAVEMIINGWSCVLFAFAAKNSKKRMMAP